MKLGKPKYIFVTGGVASSLGKGIKDVQIDVPTKELKVVSDATKN